MSGGGTFLEEFLRDGPRPTREIRLAAEARGLHWPTLRVHKDRLSIRSIRYGVWALDDGRYHGRGVPGARGWLRRFLRSGPKTIPEVKAASALAGFAWGTMRGARDKLRLRSERVQCWTLPDGTCTGVGEKPNAGIATAPRRRRSTDEHHRGTP